MFFSKNLKSCWGLCVSAGTRPPDCDVWVIWKTPLCSISHPCVLQNQPISDSKLAGEFCSAERDPFKERMKNVQASCSPSLFYQEGCWTEGVCRALPGSRAGSKLLMGQAQDGSLPHGVSGQSLGLGSLKFGSSMKLKLLMDMGMSPSWVSLPSFSFVSPWEVWDGWFTLDFLSSRTILCYFGDYFTWVHFTLPLLSTQRLA